MRATSATYLLNGSKVALDYPNRKLSVKVNGRRIRITDRQSPSSIAALVWKAVYPGDVEPTAEQLIELTQAVAVFQ